MTIYSSINSKTLVKLCQLVINNARGKLHITQNKVIATDTHVALYKEFKWQFNDVSLCFDDIKHLYNKFKNKLKNINGDILLTIDDNKLIIKFNDELLVSLKTFKPDLDLIKLLHLHECTARTYDHDAIEYCPTMFNELYKNLSEFKNLHEFYKYDTLYFNNNVAFNYNGFHSNDVIPKYNTNLSEVVNDDVILSLPLVKSLSILKKKYTFKKHIIQVNEDNKKYFYYSYDGTDLIMFADSRPYHSY